MINTARVPDNSSISTPPAPESVRDGVRLLDARIESLISLRNEFAPALEMVLDLGRVNAVLENSTRPDLVIREKAPQLKLTGLGGFSNNFRFKIQTLGYPIYHESGGSLPVAWRPLTDAEFDRCLSAIADVPGRSEGEIVDLVAVDDVAREYLGRSHLCTPAFIRMCIVLPDFSKRMINRLLEVGLSEDAFVLYSIMSELVDSNDPRAMINGEIDKFGLCR